MRPPLVTEAKVAKLFSKCIQDKGCCTYEEGTAEMPEMLKQICAADTSKDACR